MKVCEAYHIAKHFRDVHRLRLELQGNATVAGVVHRVVGGGELRELAAQASHEVQHLGGGLTRLAGAVEGVGAPVGAALALGFSLRRRRTVAAEPREHAHHPK
jgi:hypothetical protein